MKVNLEVDTCQKRRAKREKLALERRNFFYYLIMSLMFTSGIAVTVGRNSEQRKRVFIEEKKYGKRDLEGAGLQAYGYQQEHPEHIYGPPSAPAPPVYEIPAPDLAHPVPGPIPEPPVAVGHHPFQIPAVPVPVPQPVPHPVPQPIAIPVAVPVVKHIQVPVTVEKLVPVAVPVPKPYPVTVEKVVHVDRPVPVPIEKPVHIPVDRPVHVPVPVPKPYPVTFEKIVHVDRPYPVHVAVPVHVPKPYPVPVTVHAHYNKHGWW
ncbi:pollen-specific leucine-rich repeat extensin-like protein 3 [Nylanderia fulva]|uniref:pollen-specific leucine-rich repeat extensin-like protein 3 n=1 Tax=Nylanderia fulva TaxID=613905 RepID=UPI0010FB56FC|nr:pollen-specific leucine-rich repeat extensin-like protein 3 [Nylanderia fulva]XP_029174180.1 pollen-specific leucine-rich repeat extensin-like protein 3 [Nylanderia fulva]